MNDRNAIVIGSGYGGAVTACRLAQAGFQVSILERGRRYEAGDFPALPAEDSLLPDHRRWSWQADKGLWDIEDLGELINVQAAGYGGGSLVYANVHLRPPASVFEQHWPDEYRRENLDEFYNLVGYMLDASPLPRNAPAPKVEQLESYAKENKHQFLRPPLAITYPDERGNGRKHLNIERAACKFCAQCSTGCPYGAKNSLNHNYLAIAERRGARVYTRCEVTGLERVDGLWKVSYIDHTFARTGEISAPYLFLCAGTLHSTRLLAQYNAAQAKKDAAAAPAIPNVGIGYYPNADAAGMVYGTSERLDPSVGPTIGGTVVHATEEKNDFFLLQEGGYSKELDRALKVFRSGVWLNRNRVTTAKAPGYNFNEWMQSLAVSMLTPKPPFSAEALPSPADSLRTLAAGIQPGPFLVQLRAYWSQITSPLTALFGLMAGTEDPARRMMLLTMGYDRAPGVLHYDSRHGRMIADLDLYHTIPMYERQEAMMAQLATHLGGELRTNPAWTFLGKPYTVHGQGGCRMGAADSGVTTSAGAVRGKDVENLYVIDGSALCTSVGVNPSGTIAAIAERNIEIFIEAHGGFQDKAGKAEYEAHKRAAKDWYAGAIAKGWQLEPKLSVSPKLEPTGIGIYFDETMRGLFRRLTATDPFSRQLDFPEDQPDSAPRQPDPQAVREFEAGATEFAEFNMHVHVVNLRRFIEDKDHTSDVSGAVTLRLPDATGLNTYQIRRGQMKLFTTRIKDYALDDVQAKVQKKATEREYLNQQPSAADADPMRYIRYEIELEENPDRYWIIVGTKYVRQDPGIDFWEDTSTLFVTLHGPYSSKDAPAEPRKADLKAAGIVRLGPISFIEDQRKMRVVRETEPGKPLVDETDMLRRYWAMGTYWRLYYVSLQRIYSPTLGAIGGSLFSPSALSSYGGRS